MRTRIVWVRCPDCGRRGTDGGCYEVERKEMFLFWRTMLGIPSRGGDSQPAHFPTYEAAVQAMMAARMPKPVSHRVVKEFIL